MLRSLQALALGSAFLALPLAAQDKQTEELPKPAVVMPKPAVIMPAPATEEPKPDPGFQIENRGPIHEGFAQPGAPVRGKDMTAPKEPPPNVPEIPPEEKPEGSTWIPGYWQWDEGKKDFLWVSGFYRVPPQGRAWTAGQWKNQNGVQTYSPGYWRPADQNSWRIDLPEPPANIDNGPNTPAPADNMIWAQGTWQYQNGRYVWQPGQWVQPGDGMMWQQGQYVTTPYGYAYNPGYWDYPLEYRGMLNAPVYFTQPLWNTPGWCFTPTFAVGIGFGNNGWGVGGFYDSLFIGPGFNSLFFGNYYGSGWGGGGWGWGWRGGWGWGWGGGFRPWNYRAPGFCNPLYTQYAYLNRNNPAWAANVQAGNVARGLGVAPRPPVALVNNTAANSGNLVNNTRAVANNGIGRGAALPSAASAVNQPRLATASQAAATPAAVRSAPAMQSSRAIVQPSTQVAQQMRQASPVPQASAGRAAPQAMAVQQQAQPQAFRSPVPQQAMPMQQQPQAFRSPAPQQAPAMQRYNPAGMPSPNMGTQSRPMPSMQSPQMMGRPATGGMPAGMGGRPGGMPSMGGGRGMPAGGGRR